MRGNPSGCVANEAISYELHVSRVRCSSAVLAIDGTGDRKAMSSDNNKEEILLE